MALSNYTHLLGYPERRQAILEPLAPPLRHLNVPLGYRIQGLPKFYNGRLYCCDLQGSLHCLQVPEFKEQWMTRLQKSTETLGWNTGMPIVDGQWMVIDVDWKVYSVNASDGAKVLLSEEECSVWEGIIRNEVFYAMWSIEEGETELRAYSLAKRAYLWTKKCPMGGSLTLASDLLIVKVGDQNMEALSLENGDSKWSIQFEAEIQSSILFDGKSLVVGLKNGAIHIVSPDSGLVTDRIQLTESPLFLAGVGEQRLALVTLENYYLFDAKDGYRPRVLPLPSGFLESHPTFDPTRISASTTHIYFADQREGSLHALNIESGEMDWSYDLHREISYMFAPGVTHGALYCVDMEGNLHQFSSA